MRFSRTRLTDVLHLRCSARARQARLGRGGTTIPFPLRPFQHRQERAAVDGLALDDAEPVIDHRIAALPSRSTGYRVKRLLRTRWVITRDVFDSWSSATESPSELRHSRMASC